MRFIIIIFINKIFLEIVFIKMIIILEVLFFQDELKEYKIDWYIYIAIILDFYLSFNIIFLYKQLDFCLNFSINSL